MPLFEDQFPSLEDDAKRLDGEVSSIRKAEVKRGLEVGKLGEKRPVKVQGDEITGDGERIIGRIPERPLLTPVEFEVPEVALQHPFQGTVTPDQVISVYTGKIKNLTSNTGGDPVIFFDTVDTETVAASGTGSVFLELVGSYNSFHDNEYTDSNGDTVTVVLQHWDYADEYFYSTDEDTVQGASGQSIFVRILDYETVDGVLSITKQHVVDNIEVDLYHLF